MKTELPLARYIACDPARWSARLAVVEQFKTGNLAKLLASPMLATVPELKRTQTILGGDGKPRAIVTYPQAETVGPIHHLETVQSFGDEDDEDGETDCYGDPLPQMRMEGDIAIIPIQGVIYTGLPSIFKKFGYVDLDDIAEDVENAMANQNCRAIVLDVDSPGGTLRSLPEFGSMIAGFASSGEKLIAARVQGLGCSAAYWAIAGCNYISAAPSAEMVNIGVYQPNTNYTKMFEMWGIKVEMFKSGDYKAAGYPGTDLTDAQRAEWQSSIDELGAMFRAHVSACRPDAEDDDMQGQCFFGTQAVQRGFADDNSPTFAAFLSSIKSYLAVKSTS